MFHYLLFLKIVNSQSVNRNNNLKKNNKKNNKKNIIEIYINRNIYKYKYVYTL